MKTNGTLITGKIRLVALVLVPAFSAKAQTSGAGFEITSFTRVTGAQTQAGSTYLFSPVYPGIDCRVTISAIANSFYKITGNDSRIVKQQSIAVQPGFNSAMANGRGQMPAGRYLTMLTGTGNSYTQKILIG